MIKQPTTYDWQIAKLQERGCKVSDKELCKDALARINYYRLSAYFLPFRKGDGTYKENTDFIKIYQIYEFDRKIRNVLFMASEEVEVFLRAKLAYYHAHHYGALGYTDASNYNARHDHSDFCAHVEKAKKDNAKTLFVRHHQVKYGGQFPIWVLMEVFTFGMLSRFYADLVTADRKALARDLYHSTEHNIRSWLYCCTNLRNICAHYGRLYFSVFTSIPANIPEIPQNAKRQLFGAVMSLRGLYPNAQRWNSEILTRMTALFDEYEESISLEHIGFPTDWAVICRK